MFRRARQGERANATGYSAGKGKAKTFSKVQVTFDERLELLVSYFAALHVYLQRQQQRECVLIAFVQTAYRVLENFKCHVFNDVQNTLLGDGRFGRSEKRRKYH